MNKRLKKAVLMAGGEGVRLRPLTYIIPKPLLSLGDRTVIEHLIKCLSHNRIEEVYILVSYQYEKFKICSNYESQFNIKIRLYKEDKKMGTIGGIYHLKKELDEPFLLVNSDMIIDTDFQAMYDFHNQKEAAVTIGTKKYSLTLPYGLIERDEDGNFIKYKEKPTNIDNISIGANIISPEIFSFMTGQKLDFPDIVKKLNKTGAKIATYEVDGLWLDVGQTNDYEKAIELLLGMDYGKN